MRDYELDDIHVEADEHQPDRWVVLIDYRYTEDLYWEEFDEPAQYQRPLSVPVKNRALAEEMRAYFEKYEAVRNKLMPTFPESRIC